jgi:hypothetical protein
MGMSIEYTAARERALSDVERRRMAEVLRQFSVERQIERHRATGEGPNWDPFTLFEPPYREPGTIIEGATRLPDNTQDALVMGLQHWCDLLAELRKEIGDAQWRVSVDRKPIPWDADNEEYGLF